MSWLRCRDCCTSIYICILYQLAKLGILIMAHTQTWHNWILGFHNVTSFTHISSYQLCHWNYVLVLVHWLVSHIVHLWWHGHWHASVVIKHLRGWQTIVFLTLLLLLKGLNVPHERTTHVLHNTGLHLNRRSKRHLKLSKFKSWRTL